MTNENIRQTIASDQSSYSGDVILQNLEMGKDKGFSKVASYWLGNGCISFDDGRELLAKQQEQIEDIKGPLSDWRCKATETGIVMTHAPTQREYVPTEHAVNKMAYMGKFRQINWLLEPIGHATKKDEDGNPIVVEGGNRIGRDYQIAADIINGHLLDSSRTDQKKNRLFRTWKTGELRAVLSEQYAVVNNGWYLDLLAKLIPGGVLSHWKGDADSMYGNILIPDTIRAEEDSDFGGMLSVGNSEIGDRRIASCPSVFRAICMNGCIWDQAMGSKMDKVHRGSIDFEMLAGLIKDNLEKQIPLLPQGIERMLGIRSYGCGDVHMKQYLGQVGIDYGVTKRELTAVHNGWMDEISTIGPKDANTAYGLMNAITRAGQTLSNDRWVQFDGIGGDLVNMSRNDWDKFRDKAKNLTGKKLDARLPSEMVSA